MTGAPTLEQALGFLDREYRLRFRSAAERLALPLAERLETGETIAGLRVIEASGARVRCRTARNPSKLRVGDGVYVHPESEPPALEAALATWRLPSITAISPDGLELEFDDTVRLDARVTWCVDVVPDRRLPLTTNPSLVAGVLAASGPLGSKIRRWLDGSAVRADDAPLRVRGLVDAQQRAAGRACRDEVAVIQGPPGTGKTFVLAAVLERLVREGQRVLVCCFSHTAIDNVLRACAARDPRLPLHRVGHREEDPPLPPGCREHRALGPVGDAGIWGMTAFKAARPWVQPLARSYKPVIERTPAEERTASTYADATRRAWAAAALPDPADFFDVVVIDEAGQMSIPTALMALLHGTRCVLVGDHRQLPPVAQSAPDFAPSVFDHAIDVYRDRSVMLDRTFRLNRELCASPSRLFYGGLLACADHAARRRLTYPGRARRRPPAPWLRRALDPGEPVLLLSVDHDVGADESPEEARLVARVLIGLLERGLDVRDGVAVVCAHRRQNALVRQEAARLATTTLMRRAVDAVVCDTVERIQGQEREVVVVSLTGSDPHHLVHQWTFSHCPRRFNVAITRPRTKLIVVGSPRFFWWTPGVEVPPGEDAGGPSLAPAAGLARLKRWYLDRLDAGEVERVTLDAVGG